MRILFHQSNYGNFLNYFFGEWCDETKIIFTTGFKDFLKLYFCLLFLFRKIEMQGSLFIITGATLPDSNKMKFFLPLWIAEYYIFCQVETLCLLTDIVWNVSKYGVFSSRYFAAFGLNTERYEFSPNGGKYGPEKTQYLDTFHAV